MTFNKGKSWVLHLAHNNCRQQFWLLEEWLEICPAENDLRVLVDSWLTMGQPIKPIASWSASDIVWPEGLEKYLSPCMWHYCMWTKPQILCSIWGSHYKKYIELLEHVQRIAMKLVKGL